MPVQRAAIAGKGDKVAIRAVPRLATVFRAMRTKPKAQPRIVRKPVTRQISDVAYDTLESPRALGAQSGVYVPYRRSRIEIAGVWEHPTPLVESVAMGSIPAPIPDYTPRLHERILEKAQLSEAQLVTIIYAGNAWLQYLP